MHAYFTKLWHRLVFWRVIESHKSSCKQEEPIKLVMEVVRRGGVLHDISPGDLGKAQESFGRNVSSVFRFWRL